MSIFFFLSHSIFSLKTYKLEMSVAVMMLILWEHSIIVSAGVNLLKPVELLLLFITLSAEQLKLCKRGTNCHLGVCQERTGTI